MSLEATLVTRQESTNGAHPFERKAGRNAPSSEQSRKHEYHQHQLCLRTRKVQTPHCSEPLSACMKMQMQQGWMPWPRGKLSATV